MRGFGDLKKYRERLGIYERCEITSRVSISEGQFVIGSGFWTLIMLAMAFNINADGFGLESQGISLDIVVYSNIYSKPLKLTYLTIFVFLDIVVYSKPLKLTYKQKA